MADDLALDLQELRKLQSIAKRPRVLSLISSEITNLEKVLFNLFLLFGYFKGSFDCMHLKFVSESD